MDGKQHLSPFELPVELHHKLMEFRRRTWTNKIAEAVAAAITLSSFCYFVVFLSDRFIETPVWVRALCWIAAAVGWWLGLPAQLYRWVWCRRNLHQIAQLIAQNDPYVGDRLLGVISLVQQRQEQHVSPALCRAAIQQVADDTRSFDFNQYLSSATCRVWLTIALTLLLVGSTALLIPGAGPNAFQRWLQPWSTIQRFTFTRIDGLSKQQVVAVGEPFDLRVGLAKTSRWRPSTASLVYRDQPAIDTKRTDQGYVFHIPAQTQPGSVRIGVGDARAVIQVDPLPRPELRSIVATVQWPAYLGREDKRQDVRSGNLSVLHGSRVGLVAEATRELAAASFNGSESDVTIETATMRTGKQLIQDDALWELRWIDVEGLASQTPFNLRVRIHPDQPPVVQCTGIPTDQVVLDAKTLTFDVVAADDFGVKSVGVQWSVLTMEPDANKPTDPSDPSSGEYLLASGAHDAERLELVGTFNPKQLDIPPKPIDVRVYVEDYRPGGGRIYTPAYRLYVLDRNQHVVWVTRQLENWERQALAVRDEEQYLLKENRALQQLDSKALHEPATRQRLTRQAAAERANARKLALLTEAGEQLILEASKNDEFDADTLQRWARVMQSLRQIARTQMPSVARQLAAASSASGQSPDPSTIAPSVSDSERGTAGADDSSEQDTQDPTESSNRRPVQNRLDLVQTTLSGQSAKNSVKSNADESSAALLETAIQEQTQLLEQFNRVMDDIKKILKQLQDSTFVKRLKAAADAELRIAGDLHEELVAQFGLPKADLTEANVRQLARMAKDHRNVAQKVQLIQEDLNAYFQRTGELRFRQVHDEMAQVEVVPKLNEIAPLIDRNFSGRMIAEAEYWADQFDRWAEMLVADNEPKQREESSEQPAEPPPNVPPQIVLEVMRILKAEVDLRAETRSAEQIRSPTLSDVYRRAALRLCQAQGELAERLEGVIHQFRQLEQDKGKQFPRQRKQLAIARSAMLDAEQLLGWPETGPRVIAAETEAIEALLITRRAGTQGGSGSSTYPGSGRGKGKATAAPGLAGIGGAAYGSQREVEQATGTARVRIPDEFRSGLDAYFSALDSENFSE